MPATPAPPGRLESLDGLRGLAAVVVLVHHSLLVVPALAEPYYGKPAEPGLASWLVHTPLHLAWAGTEGVYLFFVLSGLVLALATRSRSFSWGSYFPSRIVRLYVPALAAIAFAAVVIAVLPRDGASESIWLERRPDGYTLAGVLRDAVLVNGVSGTVSPLWSLQWEVLFSLLLPVYLYLSRRAPVWLQLLVCFALSTLGAYSGVAALRYLPMFGIGLALAAGWDRLGEAIGRMSRRTAAVVWPIAVTAALLGIVSYWMVLPFTTDAVARVATMAPTLAAVALFIVAAVHAPGLRSLLSSRVFRWLGGISFSLYLVHEPIVIATAHLVSRPMLTVFVAAPVALVVAWLFFRAVESPAHRLARRVRDDARERMPVSA